tara:strand:- start:935 stop:1126 length:192 start_codon:yes stop_codon:yes gene_type:complete
MFIYYHFIFPIIEIILIRLDKFRNFVYIFTVYRAVGIKQQVIPKKQKSPLFRKLLIEILFYHI